MIQGFACPHCKFRATEKCILKKHLQFHRNNKNGSTKRDENGYKCDETRRKRDVNGYRYKGVESDGTASTYDEDINVSKCPPARKKCYRTFAAKGNGMQTAK